MESISKEVLNQKWEEYKQEVKNGANPQQLYQEEIWPSLLALWKENPIVSPEFKKFDVSIHTLGTSPEATTLAILGTQADEIYILHTPETQKHIEKIEADTGKRVYPLEIQKSDVTKIYEKVVDIITKYEDKDIALDITSGTKAMSAGLGAAGFFFRRFFDKIRVVYIDNEEYDTDLRRPRAGAEKLVILPSPHEVLADVDVLLAIEKYRSKDFYTAHDHLIAARRKSGNEKFKVFEELCLAYGKWYALEIGVAAKRMEEVLRNLEKDQFMNDPLRKYYNVFKIQKQILDAIKDVIYSKEEKSFENKKGILALAETLLWIANKYGTENKILSSLYTYRAFELLLQLRLYSLGKTFETSSLTAEEQNALIDTLRKIFEQVEQELRPKLGLLQILVYLLNVKDECTTKVISAEDVRNLAFMVSTRNSSILIHGLNIPEDKQIEKLKEKTEKLLKEIKRTERLDFSIQPVNIDYKLVFGH
ncbi:MAG: TIGR02710 family CRISPR-associated CARF protein [Fervidobacterium sp.]|uniref:CRISPR-associated protein, TIGR02710 family n=1 Tax=Fervidobacterium gondwanense DSM 13020 TaxID=1121883 RepID=A0A1M7TF13_FERGO|nr:TIGR02710 family CRISPR-associated CARF protein [Fervidobacterium gondwanense]UXF01869.1 hypothetical protein IB67_10265 [Fervidobacterium riparium]SHN69287.1 CRISPR-associated protein, TIGR02710 family [Fervidobacterium gondwanense DSM 13020]